MRSPSWTRRRGSPTAKVSSSASPVTKEVIAEFSAQLRSSSQVNQRSGVSVRFSIGALETLARERTSTSRRQRRIDSPFHERSTSMRSSPRRIGRVEFDMLEEGREPEVLERALKRALLEVWHYRLGGEDTSALISAFDAGLDRGDIRGDELG